LECIWKLGKKHYPEYGMRFKMKGVKNDKSK